MGIAIFGVPVNKKAIQPITTKFGTINYDLTATPHGKGIVGDFPQRVLNMVTCHRFLYSCLLAFFIDTLQPKRLVRAKHATHQTTRLPSP